MQHHSTAAPGALAANLAGHTANIRAIVREHHRPAYGIPLDGEPGGAPAPAGPGAAAGDPLGLGAGTPVHSTSDSSGGIVVSHAVTDGVPGSSPAGQAPPATPAPPAFTPPPATPAPGPPPGQQQPAGQPGTPPAPGAPAGGQPGGPPTGNPVDDAPLESFPPEIRDYVARLRKENGDNRIKAKTAEDTAAAATAAAKEEWAERVARAFGFVQDAPGDADLTPEQRIEQVTGELTTVKATNEELATSNTDLSRELAIWQAAHDHEANPKRLTDSRTFMNSIRGLDPSGEQFGAQIAAAIGTAVASDPYYRNTPAPGAPALPPVPSGGDFAGGPSGGSTGAPQTVDDYIAQRRERRAKGM